MGPDRPSARQVLLDRADLRGLAVLHRRAGRRALSALVHQLRPADLADQRDLAVLVRLEVRPDRRVLLGRLDPEGQVGLAAPASAGRIRRLPGS
jgi:hypothetical protein